MNIKKLHKHICYTQKKYITISNRTALINTLICRIREA